MKKLTAEDLLLLEHGDRIYLRSGAFMSHFDYVGRMPNNRKYLIFSRGETLKHLYISEKDNSFSGEWYSGDYKESFVIKLRIKELEKEIEKLKSELELELKN